MKVTPFRIKVRAYWEAFKMIRTYPSIFKCHRMAFESAMLEGLVNNPNLKW